MTLTIGQYRFAPRVIPTVMSLFFIAVFLCLGHWQWRRANYKERLHEQYLHSEQSSPLTLASAAGLGKDVNGFPVVLTGQFDDEHTFLLDNQVDQGVPGFQVFTVFRAGQQGFVLVDRGWLPMGRDRQHFTPVPPLASGEYRLRGKIYVPSEHQFVLQEDNLSHVTWPVLVQKLDLRRFSQVLGVELVPLVVRLDPDVRIETGEQMPRHWQFMVIGPEKSRAYAFQWFAMAIVLLGFYIYFSTEKGPIKHE